MKMNMTYDTDFGYWLRVARHTDFRMEKFSRPKYVGAKKVPDTLNEITIGQLIELGMIDGTLGSFARICEIVLQLTPEETYAARAVDVVRLCGWVTGEVERINKIFERQQSKPTQQEIQAGIKTLQFGLFGMLDWYAQRMGYQDQEDVKNVPWLRIYKCLEMDGKRIEYQKKYQEVISNEYRRKMQRNR